MTNATAILYYEEHPKKRDQHHVALIFPDLRDAGFTACHTVGNSREDVLEAGVEILEFALEEAVEKGIVLPAATPLLKVNMDHGDDDFKPFRIIVEEISI